MFVREPLHAAYEVPACYSFHIRTGQAQDPLPQVGVANAPVGANANFDYTVGISSSHAWIEAGNPARLPNGFL